MAQQVGALRIKGKVGNVVGFGNSASDKTNKNFVRQAAANVANPKTYRQATQRSKVKPAAAFYSAFENVLNHAFMPSQRASKNRNKFMKLAMLLGAVPDVPKDANYLPVLPYQISAGSLGLDQLCQLKRKSTNILAADNIATGEITDTTTVAAVTQSILAGGNGLVEGEELTLLIVTAQSTNMKNRQATYMSFVLDSNNTVTKMGDIKPDNVSWFASGDEAYGMFGVKAASGFTMLACGLIISSKTNASWRYTNSWLVLTESGEQLGANIEDVILSYMTTASESSSTRILQQANNKAQVGVVPVGHAFADVANAAGVTGTINAPAGVSLAIMSDGTRRVIVNDSGQLYKGSSDGSYLPVTRTPSGGTAQPCLIGTTNLAGNPTINVTVVQAAGIPSEEGTVNP